jgi:hypothetical protein
MLTSDDLKPWYTLTAEEAEALFPSGNAFGQGLLLPIRDDGMECPWPWEAAQASKKVKRCAYCQMDIIPGERHPAGMQSFDGTAIDVPEKLGENA